MLVLPDWGRSCQARRISPRVHVKSRNERIFFRRFHFFMLEICWLNLQDFWDPGGDKSRISIISCIFIPRNWTLTLLETLQFLSSSSSWMLFFWNMFLHKYKLRVRGIHSVSQTLPFMFWIGKETSLFIKIYQNHIKSLHGF